MHLNAAYVNNLASVLQCLGWTDCFPTRPRRAIDTTFKYFSGFDMKLFDSAFGIHERALDLRAQRMEVISRNIANVDTPYYKAQDIDFKQVLNDAQRDYSLRATHSSHIQSADTKLQANTVFTIPFNPALDGNTVEMSVEQAKYGKAAAQYQATLRFIEGDISGIRKALRGD